MRDNSYYTYRTLALMFVMLFQVLLIGAMAYLNDPTVMTKKTADAAGNFVFNLQWVETGGDDVDIWVKDPNEGVGIGYSRKHGTDCDLQFDDTGSTADGSPNHYENIFCRGVFPGEYIINVHCYRCVSVLPKAVRVQVSYMDPKTGDGTNVITWNGTLSRDGDEQTVARFKVKEDKTIDATSLNNVFFPLFPGSKAASDRHD